MRVEHVGQQARPRVARVRHDDNANGGAPSTYRNFDLANQRMAAALQKRGYHYHYDHAQGAGHVDQGPLKQTLPEALTWLWRGYAPSSGPREGPAPRRSLRAAPSRAALGTPRSDPRSACGAERGQKGYANAAYAPTGSSHSARTTSSSVSRRETSVALPSSHQTCAARPIDT